MRILYLIKININRAWIITLSQGGRLFIFRGSQVILFQKFVFLSSKIDFVLANSVDPDKMPHYAAFHLGFHSLLKYPLRGFYSKKG